MTTKDDSTIRWYANPKNWEPSVSKLVGPYSASNVAHVLIDRGAEARRQLNSRGTTGGLLSLVLELVGMSESELSRRSQVHPGRLADILNDAADALPSEKKALASVLGISASEL